MWQVSISTTPEAEEAVAAVLERHFQKPVSAYRNALTGAVFATVYPDRLPAPQLKLRAALRASLRELRGFGLEIGPARIAIKPLRRENWAESWKRHFKPIEIDRALLIKPGWIKRRPRAGQHVVILDPGLSFGTGHHPTTLFCLRQLARERRPGEKQSFLDIGTGSGILAIAAAKLGYAPVAAFDFDPDAVRICRENVKKNDVEHLVRPTRQDLTRLPVKSSRQYDVICANLVCDLLVKEASKLCARLEPGGKLIVAGILRHQFEEVRKTLHRFNLTLQVKIADKHWKSGQFVLS